MKMTGVGGQSPPWGRRGGPPKCQNWGFCRFFDPDPQTGSDRRKRPIPRDAAPRDASSAPTQTIFANREKKLWRIESPKNPDFGQNGSPTVGFGAKYPRSPRVIPRWNRLLGGRTRTEFEPDPCDRDRVRDVRKSGFSDFLDKIFIF